MWVRLSLVIMTAVLLADPGRAATTLWAASQAGSREDAAHAHTILDLLIASREQCEIAAAAATSAGTSVVAAKRMNQVGDIRAELTRTEDALGQVQQHLGSCLDVVKMMHDSGAEARGHSTPPTEADLLRQLLQHERQGLEMTRRVVQQTRNEEVKAAAADLATSQERSIHELERLTGVSPSPSSRP